MYQMKEKQPMQKKPVNSGRERPDAGRMPEYMHGERDTGHYFPEPMQREPLAYTREERSVSDGADGVIQRFWFGFGKKSKTIDNFADFSGVLEGKIRGHIESVELDGENFYTAVERDLFCHCETDLWDQIKESFLSDNRNITILIAKVLSTNTPGVENPDSPSSVKNCFEEYLSGGQIKDTVISAFDSLREPISQTLNDIYYWLSQRGAENVAKITLTDSDIHTRGVGVCIVSYGTFSGASEQIVVKPEEKSFEKAVYGKEEDSLANRFNGYLAEGHFGEALRNGEIGTLDIGTSPGNQHGSMVEFFAHQQFDKTDKAQIDRASAESHIAFASLLGLADLHKENAVYSAGRNQNGGYSMQLIDAEIGMKFPLRDSTEGGNAIAPLQSAAYFGEMMGLAPSIEEDLMQREDFESYSFAQASNFIAEMKGKFQPQTSRLVLIPTPGLFSFRSEFLKENNAWRDYYFSDLTQAIKNYFSTPYIVVKEIVGDAQKEMCIDAAASDFERGRIPYYKIEFGTGRVIHEAASGNVVVAQYTGADGRGFLDAMTANRLGMLAMRPAEPEAGAE